MKPWSKTSEENEWLYQAFAKIDAIMSDYLNQNIMLPIQKLCAWFYWSGAPYLILFSFLLKINISHYLKKKSWLSPCLLMIKMSLLFIYLFTTGAIGKKLESIRPPLNIAESTIHSSLDCHVETTERSRQHIHSVHLIYISIQDLKRVWVCVWETGYVLISGLCTQTGRAVISKIPDLISNFKSSGCADKQLC